MIKLEWLLYLIMAIRNHFHKHHKTDSLKYNPTVQEKSNFMGQGAKTPLNTFNYSYQFVILILLFIIWHLQKRLSRLKRKPFKKHSGSYLPYSNQKPRFLRNFNPYSSKPLLAKRNYFPKKDVKETSETYLAKNQLDLIKNIPFQKRQLLNWEELQVFWVILGELKGQSTYKVNCQVNLGEFIGTPKKVDGQNLEDHTLAFHCINTKRVDFLICDQQYHPVLVIEHQGSGHFGKTAESKEKAEISDEVKRQVFRSADIGLIETDSRLTIGSSQEIREARSGFIEKLWSVLKKY